MPLFKYKDRDRLVAIKIKYNSGFRRYQYYVHDKEYGDFVMLSPAKFTSVTDAWEHAKAYFNCAGE